MSNKEDSYKEFLNSLEARNNSKWTIQLEKYLKSGGEVKICVSCNSPTFGHIDTQCREVKTKKYSDEVAQYFETQLLKEVQNILTKNMSSSEFPPAEKETLNAILSRLSDSVIQTQQFQKSWIENNESKSSPKMSKLVKPPKPPVWTKEMEFETYEKQVSRWNDNEKEVTEADKYHELIEDLKKNKEILGLSQYVNDQIIETCNEEKEQNIKRIIDVLRAKYGRTELEKLEKLWDYFVNFKIDKEIANDSLLEKIKKVVDYAVHEVDISKKIPQFLALWMFRTMQASHIIEGFEANCLRKVLKNNKSTVVEDFCEQFKDLKIEGKRDHSLLKSDSLITSNYIGKESSSRKRFQEQQSRS